MIDASALLAFLQRETGDEEVASALEHAVMSAVNYSEVCQRFVRHGRPIDALLPSFEALGLRVLPFDTADAEIAASLWEESAHLGLSLGDRACLALGMRLDLPVLTADRAWTDIAKPPAKVRLIRS